VDIALFGGSFEICVAVDCTLWITGLFFPLKDAKGVRFEEDDEAFA